MATTKVPSDTDMELQPQGGALAGDAEVHSASDDRPHTISTRLGLDITAFGPLLGKSRAMRELFAELESVSATDLSLLVEGETGTGKELVAQAVHQASPRARRPFVVFDCSAVAPTLIESELFGHERGAFTGAVTSRAGIFEQADGGTIFLDELGELPKAIQPRFLRVLEKREVRRIGSGRTLPVDVRLISATNRCLTTDVRRGTFREDLYFRVAGARICVPPFRDRMTDLPLLVEHFLAAADPPQSLEIVPASLWEAMSRHSWPGNVRELRNAVQRLLIWPERPFEDSCATTLPILPEQGFEVQPLKSARSQALERFERSYLDGILKSAEGNVTRAAALAQVSRQVIHKLMRRHGL